MNVREKMYGFTKWSEGGRGEEGERRRHGDVPAGNSSYRDMAMLMGSLPPLCSRITNHGVRCAHHGVVRCVKR